VPIVTVVYPQVSEYVIIVTVSVFVCTAELIGDPAAGTLACLAVFVARKASPGSISEICVVTKTC